MSVRSWLTNCFVRLTPPSRAFVLRAVLWNFAGNRISLSARLVSSVRIIGPVVEVGDDSFIGHETMLTGAVSSSITIGSCCDIAPRVLLVTGSHEIDPVGKHSAGEGIAKNIVIKDGVWIGAGSTILGGVTIGEKAVIGAGSIVTKDIPPYTIAYGCPCKPQRNLMPEGVESK